MATTFVEVLLQLRDQFGADTLSGGKIETFEAGTTTPLATYQDLAGSTANTNPVILDSAGMAQIRQTDGVAYKWVVYDADDNELWTRDNITVGFDPDAAGSDYLVHFNHSGTLGAQQFMSGHIFDRAVTFPIDLEGAQGAAETSPAATCDIKIRKNGVQVATASVSTAGVYTFTSVGGVSISCASGDKMTFIGPDVADATGADFYGTLVGDVA